MSRRLSLLVVLFVTLCGCEGLVGVSPTATPTVFLPPVPMTPTLELRPPTPVFGEQPSDDGRGRNNPTAAAAPVLSFIPTDIGDSVPDRPLLVTVNTPSGDILNGELYPGQPGNAGVLLVSTRFEGWFGFPVTLQQAGYTVLSVETRVPAAAGDFGAMLDALTSYEGVDGARVGVIGETSGADVTLLGCSEDDRCDALVLLSPTQQTAGINALRVYNPRPLLIAASEDDPGAVALAEALRLEATGEALLQPFEEAGQGAQMLVNREDFPPFVIAWLGQYLNG